MTPTVSSGSDWLAGMYGSTLPDGADGLDASAIARTVPVVRPGGQARSPPCGAGFARPGSRPSATGSRIRAGLPELRSSSSDLAGGLRGSPRSAVIAFAPMLLRHRVLAFTGNKLLFFA